jgi:glycosyltransferase involved in cell wall biosynthesis
MLTDPCVTVFAQLSISNLPARFDWYADMRFRLVTDFENTPQRLALEEGDEARLIYRTGTREVLAALPGADAVVINGTISVIFQLVLYFLVFPWKRKPIVAVDLVLRAPRTLKQRIGIVFKRLLLSRVDYFIHYFEDLRGYQLHYGIGSDRSAYIPFKVNIWKTDTTSMPVEEAYVFTVGISQRDYGTFIEAISRLPYPAAMPKFSFANFENRTSDFAWTMDNLPANLQLLADTGSDEDLVRNLARAKVVVIPTLGSSLCASGISTYLDAMYLGKCVVASRGPGTSDLLRSGQAILVPPEDPEALRTAIREVWEDPELRKRLAATGHRYALSLGGEKELLERVFQKTAEFLRARRSTVPHRRTKPHRRRS